MSQKLLNRAGGGRGHYLQQKQRVGEQRWTAMPCRQMKGRTNTTVLIGNNGGAGGGTPFLLVKCSLHVLSELLQCTVLLSSQQLEVRSKT